MLIEDRYYLHLFNCLPEFGPTRLGRLANYFPDFGTAYYATRQELLEANIEPKVIDQWFKFKVSLYIRRSLEQLKHHNIGVLIYSDAAYPQLLREIPQAPPLLYYRGELKSSEKLCLSVVGTRKISAYGQAVTPDLVGPLAQAGITIVSGLAYGTDALAHRATLDHNGRTIAVLGGGLDDATLYPRAHLQLAHDIIASGGLLLSEYPPGCPALRRHFVVRNRIIAGLAAGTLVIEGDLKSGALVTAERAKEQGRVVYAVPGSIHSAASRGPNDLLRRGAQVVTAASDILSKLNLELALSEAPSSFNWLTQEEQGVLELLRKEPTLVDDIVAGSSLEPAIITAALTFLEIKGYARNLGGQQYIRMK